MATFIIECPKCNAKVGAEQHGVFTRASFDSDAGEPFGERIVIGQCPSCSTALVGRAAQTEFEGWEGSEYDVYGDVVRVFPKPPKTFASYRIPRTLSESLLEADRCLQVGANNAACVMMGRALEALCRDILENKQTPGDDRKSPPSPKRRLMLGAGIRELKEKKIIDDRLFDWSQDLQAFRNLAAHPEDIAISRQDAEDLQAFVYAITEYVYDLTDRYNEFKERAANKKKRPSAASLFGLIAPVKPETN